MENAIIKLELTLAEVNGIMTSLGNMPYGQVAPLIDKVRAQAIPQVPQQVPQTEETVQ